MKSRYILPLLVAVALVGCENFLVEEPESFFSPANFPAGEADLNLSLGGIQTYTTSAQLYNRAWWFIAEAPSDHTLTPYSSGSRYQHHTFTVVPENQYVEWAWRGWYEVINASNVLIERIPQMQSMNEAKRAQYMGAAKFWRGFAYFNLARAWGDVPLHTKPITSLQEAQEATRAPLAEVYEVIVSDLQEAANTLPTSWPEGPGKPTKGAAFAALADAYLNMSGEPLKQNKWADAARAAKAVMDLGVHRLRPDFADLWLIRNETDPEFIFSIQYHNTVGSQMTVQTRPGSIPKEAGWNFWNTSEEFVDSFSDQDARKAATFKTEVVIDGKTYHYKPGLGALHWGGSNKRNHRPYWAKYWDTGRPVFTDRARRTDQNVPVYRYADVLLMFAEAENEANGPTAAAYNAINQVRARANLPPLAGLSQAQLREAIRQERSRELAFEMKRWFDLKRWGTWLEVMSKHPEAGPNVAAHHRWSPIPQQELDNSPGLTQNPGY